MLTIIPTPVFCDVKSITVEWKTNSRMFLDVKLKAYLSKCLYKESGTILRISMLNNQLSTFVLVHSDSYTKHSLDWFKNVRTIGSVFENKIFKESLLHHFIYTLYKTIKVINKERDRKLRSRGIKYK